MDSQMEHPLTHTHEHEHEHDPHNAGVHTGKSDFNEIN